MEFDGNIEYLRLAFWQIIMTSINEMTLSFVPKLILVLTTIALLSGLMMTQMSNYFAFIFQEISLVGR
jgi:flagellar biosynthetic protein FliQ